MILNNPADAIHKAWLYRLLIAITDNLVLIKNLRFKGGTCCSMLGILERFSVDLDFDLLDGDKSNLVKENLEIIFSELNLQIKDHSTVAAQYFLKYPNPNSGRSLLKLDVSFPTPKSNQYKATYFEEIDKVINCQTLETMFANKLVALIDRYDKNQSIAGRDIYDIHAFFLKGIKYNIDVIQERTSQNKNQFIKSLISFIEDRVTQKVIDEDLNSLVPYKEFKVLRKGLRKDVLMLLRGEIEKTS
jgi:predicted nucleotidyltransferase component of viral defense system